MPVEEKKREQIRKEAKRILDNFSKALEKVKFEESNVIREEDRREEKEGLKCKNDFREIMFENAAQKDKDFIIAEKKRW